MATKRLLLAEAGVTVMEFSPAVTMSRDALRAGLPLILSLRENFTTACLFWKEAELSLRVRFPPVLLLTVTVASA